MIADRVLERNSAKAVGTVRPSRVGSATTCRNPGVLTGYFAVLWAESKEALLASFILTTGATLESSIETLSLSKGYGV